MINWRSRMFNRSKLLASSSAVAALLLLTTINLNHAAATYPRGA